MDDLKGEGKDIPLWYPTDVLLAKTSSAAYKGIPSLKKLGYERVFKFRSKRTGTKAYLCLHDTSEQAVLVFRGTEADDPKDVATDINLKKTHYTNYNIHTGFMEAFKSVATKIDNAIKKLPRKYTLTCTGHSLGGALSTIYAVYGRKYTHRLVTFGSPRVGGLQFSNDLKCVDYTRYVNASDIVPRVPKIGYWHGGVLNLITSSGTVIKNPSWVRLLYLRTLFLNYLRDHSISEYIRKISL